MQDNEASDPAVTALTENDSNKGHETSVAVLSGEESVEIVDFDSIKKKEEKRMTPNVVSDEIVDFDSIKKKGRKEYGI